MIDAGDVVATRDLVLAFLMPLSTRDWAAPVPDLEWDCTTTLRHMITAQGITLRTSRRGRPGGCRCRDISIPG